MWEYYQIIQDNSKIAPLNTDSYSPVLAVSVMGGGGEWSFQPVWSWEVIVGKHCSFSLIDSYEEQARVIGLRGGQETQVTKYFRVFMKYLTISTLKKLLSFGEHTQEKEISFIFSEIAQFYNIVSSQLCKEIQMANKYTNKIHCQKL